MYYNLYQCKISEEIIAKLKCIIIIICITYYFSLITYFSQPTALTCLKHPTYCKFQKLIKMFN